MGTSPPDYLVSYPGHSLGVGSYPSVEVQSVYSTAPADWARSIWHKSKPSSSCRVASTDISDPLSPLLPIIYRLRQVFRVTSCVLTYLLYVRSSWLSCFCTAICGVHRSTSLMSSSLLLQQYPACLVRLTCIVFVMGGKCPYSWCLVGSKPFYLYFPS